MQEATQANPYEYTDDDPVNEKDTNGKNAWGDAFISCVESAPIIAIAAVSSGLSIIGGIAAYLPQFMALFIAEGTPAVATLTTIGGIRAGVAIFRL